MNGRSMKKVAGALLALALAGIAVSLVANQKSVAIQGPGALRAVGADHLWLGVDEELWVLDAQGRRRAVRNTQTLGLSEAISNIVPATDGQVLLSSRGDPHWQLVDPATLQRVRTIQPQWPEEFAGTYLRAVHIAVSPQGDIAAATGGGHAVLLFDREGRFRARTAPGTYRFTNGLWWSPEGWWTTDTNRFALHLLDAATLQVKRTIELRRSPPVHPYLGEAIPSQGAPWPGTGLPPLATLTRLGSLMEPGHVVDVFPNGMQVVFNPEVIAQLRDIAWFDGHLLAVDGEAFAVRRFDAERRALAPFGDAQVQATLAQLRADRSYWRTLGSQYALLLSALLLVAGLAAYARSRQLEAAETIAAREAGIEAAPATPLGQLVLKRLGLYGTPLAVRLAVLGLSLFVLFPVLHWWLLGPWPRDVGASLRLLALVASLPQVPLALWQQWRQERLSVRPEYEQALNHRAIEWLRAHDDFDRIKLPSEAPRETVHLPGWHSRWLLVTNRRILLFVASARERRLASEWPRRAVVAAEVPGRVSAWEWFWGAPNLVLTFTTGTTLRLRCASAVTARRVAELLMSSPALPDANIGTMQIPLPAPRRWHEVLASFVVPGSGQWLQGRFTTGIVLFTAGLLLCIYVWAPVLWALHGPKMEVSARSVANAFIAWLVIALVASSDAWRFSAARR